MTSIKRLKSVIQSTAHHAVSGLCYVHPHLGEECKKAGIKSIGVNLLTFSFDPELLTISKELELSTNALRKKFTELLATENVRILDIESAYAIFFFLSGSWPTSCYIEVFTTEGKKIEVAIDLSGKKAKVLHHPSS